MINIKYILIICIFSKVLSNYLTKNQWTSIKKIIQYTNTNININININTNINKQKEIREKINNILFFHYNNWASYHAYEFKQKHPYKCIHIPLNELIIYSSIGLYKSIQNYKGTSEFTQYALHYINGELYRAITELHPITTIPKKVRRKQKKNQKIQNNEKCKTILMKDSNWLLNGISTSRFNNEHICFHNYYDYLEVWNKVNTLEPFTKKIIHYKFDFYFNKMKSNKDISSLLDVSEETIRKRLIDTQL